jgi:two-component system, chemotaxis family, chemotaxis protein CheY
MADGTPLLVVDDDPAIRATVADFLKLEGYSVKTAANGMEALRTVAGQRPALVLLDMRMPVLDGWGFVHRLRGAGVDVPILVMTAAYDAHDWAREIGAAGCLSKPFEANDLIEAVRRLVP